MLSDCALDILKTLTGVNCHEIRAIICGSDVGKELTNTVLKLLLFVTLLAPSASLCSIFGRDVEEQTEVGTRKAFLWMAAPRETKAGVVLGRGVDATGIVIPVYDDGNPGFDVCFNRGTVCGERMTRA